MYSKNDAELHRLLQEYVSSIEFKKFNSGSLNELTAVLSRLGIYDRKTSLKIKSVLNSNSPGRRIGFSKLSDVHRYLKNLNKINIAPLREIYGESNKNVTPNIQIPGSTEINWKSSYRLRSSFKPPEKCNLIISECNVLVNEVNGEALSKGNNVSINTPFPAREISTSSQTSQSEFLKYFKLGAAGGACSAEPAQGSSNITLSTFKNSTNMPLSSELGRSLAQRVNHNVSEEFKLRKIQRLERYINKPFIAKSQVIDYPVTYVEKNSTSAVKRPLPKSNQTHILKKLCVSIETVDLSELQKKYQSKLRRRYRDKRYRLKKKCKDLSIVLTQMDKQNVEKFLKKNKKK